LNLVIIANCQVLPLAKKLSGLSMVKNLITIPVHLMGHELYKNGLNEFEKIKNDIDTNVITFNLSDKFGDLQTNFLRNNIEKLYTINNIHFSGLHPDVTYLSDMGKRVESPVGDYHSKIIIYSYLMNIKVDECIKLFNIDTYSKLGYFSDFYLSAKELLDRESDVDIKFANIFLKAVINQHSMFTFNHPTSYIFDQWARFIANHLRLDYPSYDYTLDQNLLSSNTWWPVYPEIANIHNCSYAGSYCFKQIESGGGKFLDLAQLVDESYQIYTRNDEYIKTSKQAVEIVQRFNSKKII
jgi:hypothetical protein